MLGLLALSNAWMGAVRTPRDPCMHISKILPDRTTQDTPVQQQVPASSSRLFALPRTANWKYLPLQNVGSKKFSFSRLFALPGTANSNWKYLPLQNVGSKKPSLSIFALAMVAASRMVFVASGKNDSEWERYLPLQSSVRITKALVKRKQQQLLSGDFSLFSPSFSSVAESTIAAPAAKMTAAASSASSTPLSILFNWCANLLISLKVINRKVN